MEFPELDRIIHPIVKTRVERKGGKKNQGSMLPPGKDQREENRETDLCPQKTEKGTKKKKGRMRNLLKGRKDSAVQPNEEEEATTR